MSRQEITSLFKKDDLIVSWDPSEFVGQNYRHSERSDNGGPRQDWRLKRARYRVDGKDPGGACPLRRGYQAYGAQCFLSSLSA